MKTQRLHIGNLIANVLKDKHITNTEFANKINTTKQNVTRILKNDNIDVNKLFTISKVLDYDFFQHYRLYQEDVPFSNIKIEMKVRTDNLGYLMKWVNENNQIKSE